MSTIEELQDLISKCDYEIFALEERKRELRRTIRVIRFTEKEKKPQTKIADDEAIEAEKTKEKIRNLLS